MGWFQFLFGDGRRERAQRDQYRPSTVAKNLISPVNDYGTCFDCQGTGSRSVTCSRCRGVQSTDCTRCQGTGLFAQPEQICFRCRGSGMDRGRHCSRCYGTGSYRKAMTKSCDKCGGSGRRTKFCDKCRNNGSLAVTCKKCGGSGWFRFRKK